LDEVCNFYLYNSKVLKKIVTENPILYTIVRDYPTFFKKGIKSRDVSKIIEFSKHGILTERLYSLKGTMVDIMNIMSFDKRITNKYRISGIGFIETKLYNININSLNTLLNYERMENDIKNGIDKDNSYLKEPFIFSSELLNKWKSQNIKVNELLTKAQLSKEGLDMHHCISGYAHKISEEFEVYSIISDEDRSTVSIEVRKLFPSDKTIIKFRHVSQHVSKFNKPCSEQHRNIAKEICNDSFRD
jgi:hypothetical protein